MEEDYEIIENVVKQILTDFKEKVVIPGDVYDVRAIGPQKYTDYMHTTENQRVEQET